MSFDDFGAGNVTELVYLRACKRRNRTRENCSEADICEPRPASVGLCFRPELGRAISIHILGSGTF